MSAEHVDLSLIGEPRARERLPTPSLILDLDIVEENILEMAQRARHHNMKLRPHCKSHKSSLLAKLQIEAGAEGICCATLGEAEEMVKAGIHHILITSELVSPEKIEKLIELNDKASEIIVVCDNKNNVQDLAKAFIGKKPLKILIDVDVGQKTTGVKTKEEALLLANLITSLPQLQFQGIQAYAGHVQHIENYEKRKTAVLEQNAFITNLLQEFQKNDLSCLIITGGGTGTFDIDMKAGIYTDLQVGSYLFMDVKHQAVQLTQEAQSPFKPSLFILTSVISTSKGYAITDAGFKALASSDLPPKIIVDEPSTLSYVLAGSEQGKISWKNEEERLELGQKVLCLAPYSDAVVNLYNFFSCLRKDVLIDFWPIQARGLH